MWGKFHQDQRLAHTVGRISIFIAILLTSNLANAEQDAVWIGMSEPAHGEREGIYRATLDMETGASASPCSRPRSGCPNSWRSTGPATGYTPTAGWQMVTVASRLSKSWKEGGAYDFSTRSRLAVEKLVTWRSIDRDAVCSRLSTAAAPCRRSRLPPMGGFNRIPHWYISRERDQTVNGKKGPIRIGLEPIWRIDFYLCPT